MKKLQFLLGALAISATLMFITEAKASSNATALSECKPFPNDACLIGWDATGEPIYLIDYQEDLPIPW